MVIIQLLFYSASILLVPNIIFNFLKYKREMMLHRRKNKEWKYRFGNFFEMEVVLGKRHEDIGV
jgi:hypothetical protein